MTKHSNTAFRFVLLLGFVSLFADMTYEAARSITGPYLAILGASATVVGATAGLGEFIGYGLRILSGIISDRTRKYWLITIAGYSINLLAVPFMALVGHWEIAAILIIAERFGKAVRTPARDTMLSYATSTMGRGWGFGIHEAMDQVGAMLGPIIVTAVLAWKGSYRYGFAVLIFPAVIALAILIVARITYPQPEDLEPRFLEKGKTKLRKTFWLYMVAAGFVALGMTDYPLIAFHIKSNAMFADKWIPLIYAGAMGVDGLSALVCGRLFDRKGLIVLITVVAVSAFCAPLVFLGGPVLLLAGILLWSIGLGAQESIVRALVSELVPSDRRATGYGIFNAGFGFAWFAGSLTLGVLYDRSLIALAVFSPVAQWGSIPLLYLLHKRLRSDVQTSV